MLAIFRECMISETWMGGKDVSGIKLEWGHGDIETLTANQVIQ